MTVVGRAESPHGFPPPDCNPDHSSEVQPQEPMVVEPNSVPCLLRTACVWRMLVAALVYVADSGEARLLAKPLKLAVIERDCISGNGIPGSFSGCGGVFQREPSIYNLPSSQGIKDFVWHWTKTSTNCGCKNSSRLKP